jgi:YcaO-like protein with predicted kinase domain
VAPVRLRGLSQELETTSFQLLDGAGNVPISLDHDRCVSASNTLQNLRPHFQDLGITRLGDLTGLDVLGIPVAFASRPNSFSLSLSLGKGLDRELAFASAAMEAAELAVAERPPATLVQANLDELRENGETIVNLARMARCQPQLLDSGAPIDWVEGHDLVTGQRTLVPWALVGLDHRLKPRGYHDAFEVSTDGLASGNTTAEAVLHGIYELIERDAYGLLEFLPKERILERVFTPCGLTGTRIEGMLESIARAGMHIHLIDMSTDISVSAYMAVLSSPSQGENGGQGPSPVCIGCGCHSYPIRAITRAVTEAAQARVAFVAGARDDFQAMGSGTGEARTRANSWVDLPSVQRRVLPHFDSAGQVSFSTIGDQIGFLLSKLVAVGIEQAVVVRLPSDAWGISVVRVLIPDLQIPLHGSRSQVSSRGLRQLLGMMS